MTNFNLIGHAAIAVAPGVIGGGIWKNFVHLKDMPLQVVCKEGFGNDGVLNQGMQVLNSIKDNEKHSDHRWAIIAVPIITNSVYNCIVKADGDGVNLKELSDRCVLTFKKNLNLLKVLSFLSTTIPLYNLARLMKNTIWTGNGFDPSGHVMFKVIQQGLLISTMSSCENVPKLMIINGCFILMNIVADTAMIANTTANCHTLNEVIVGASLGLGVLTTSLLINQLGQTLINKYWPFVTRNKD